MLLKAQALLALFLAASAAASNLNILSEEMTKKSITSYSMDSSKSLDFSQLSKAMSGLAITRSAITQAGLVISIEPFGYHSDMDGFAVLTRGEQLREATQKATLKATVKCLDEEMENILDSESHINEKTIWITQIFTPFYLADGIYDDLHEVASEEKAINFLKASIVFNHCEYFDDFLPFLISSYESSWYHKDLWAWHKINWSEVKLDMILKASNPRFVEDFLSNQLPFTTHHSLSNDQILDLIAEYDFLDIFNHYKTLGLVTFEQLHKRIGKLIQFGSVKLLRVLHGSTGKNLNLQDYFTYLEKLPKHPKDWEFLKEQGYQYMPVDKILEAACRGGHAYILKEFYKINEELIPDDYDLKEAAKRGHWSIIKWAIDRGISNEKGRMLLHAILGENFEFIHLFENEYKFKIDINSKITADLYGYYFTQGASVVQVLADKAAEFGRSRVVEWISDKFNVLPEKYKLSGATVRILKLLKLKKPEIFDANLLKSIEQMSSIKWMWSNYDELFTSGIKKEWTNGDRNGKELRWIHKNWKILPKSINSNISTADFEFFMKATEGKVDISGVAWCAIREGDFEKVKFLISKHPSCLKMKFIDTATECGNIEITNMLDKHFGYQFVDIKKACKFGHLEILKRSLVGGGNSPDQIKGGVLDAIRADQLEIVDYMMNKGYADADKAKYYMDTAIKFDSVRAFGLLIKRFGGGKLPENYFMDCWECKSFKILKFIMPRLSKSEIEMLLEQDFDRSNYHLQKIVEDEYEKRTQGV